MQIIRGRGENELLQDFQNTYHFFVSFWDSKHPFDIFWPLKPSGLKKAPTGKRWC